MFILKRVGEGGGCCTNYCTDVWRFYHVSINLPAVAHFLFFFSCRNPWCLTLLWWSSCSCALFISLFMHFHRNPIRDFITHRSKQNTIPHYNVHRSGFMAPCYKYERPISHASVHISDLTWQTWPAWWMREVGCVWGGGLSCFSKHGKGGNKRGKFCVTMNEERNVCSGTQKSLIN